MSILDDLFGATAARRDVRRGYDQSENIRNAGAAEADALLAGSLDDQLATLGRGDARAVRGIRRGARQARGDIRGGMSRARGDIRDGTSRAIDAEQDFLDRATGVYQPYIDDGNAAGDVYQSALGLNGAEAQQGFYDDFENDPYHDFQVQQALEQMEQANNASGVSGGRELVAGQRVAQEMGAGALQDRMNRLSGLYDMAVQSSDRVGQLTAGTGQRVAGYEANRGSQLANIATGGAQNLAGIAQNRGTNLAGQANTNATNVAGVQGGNAGERANLAFGNAQLSANNRLNLGNAVAATRGTGVNNLINLAGTAAKAYAGMA